MNSHWSRASRRSMTSLANASPYTRRSLKACRAAIWKRITRCSTISFARSYKKPGAIDAPGSSWRGFEVLLSVRDGERTPADGGADEGAEGGFVLRALGEHRLRVPLHAEHEGALRHLDRLDQAVRRPAAGDEARAEVLDALVVEGVGADRRSAVDLREESRRGNLMGGQVRSALRLLVRV